MHDATGPQALGETATRLTHSLTHFTSSQIIRWFYFWFSFVKYRDASPDPLSINRRRQECKCVRLFCGR